MRKTFPGLKNPVRFHAPRLPKRAPVGKTGTKILKPFPKPPLLTVRHMVALPEGPKMYRQTRGQALPKTGPGQAPTGFVTKAQTATEWVWYWASMKVLDPERDPRKPPFWGGQQWAYQSQQLGNIPGVHAKSLSTNIDFLYMLSWPYTAVRIQTFRYHTGATSIKQAYDRAQAVREYGAFNEVDVYEQDYIQDASGRLAILLLKETLGLVRRKNPDLVGNTRTAVNPYASLNGRSG